MPSSSSIDSYNAGIDRLYTCIMSTQYSPDGKYLVAGDDQGRLGIFNTKQLTSSSLQSNLPLSLTQPHPSFSSISLTSTQDLLISVGGCLIQGYKWSSNDLPSSTSFSIDLNRSHYMASLPSITSGDYLISCQANKQKQAELVVGSSDGALRLFNIERNTMIQSLNNAHQSSIYQLSYSSDCKRLASCSEDGTCKIWDLSQSEKQPIYTIEPDERPEYGG
ncbi:unnamed protein product, partial [Didymodactylos carnosus]